MSDFILRPLYDDDDFDALTDVLHRAFATLMAAGLNPTECDQTPEVTRERAGQGMCYVAYDDDGKPIGTITCHDANQGRSKTWYRRDDVFTIEQFGVRPEWHGRGVGAALLGRAEAWAVERGANETACDVPAKVREAQTFLTHVGYAEVDFTRWPGKNYQSLIFAKRLL